MPRSAVIYTNAAAWSDVKDLARTRWADEARKPYTFSYGQRTEAGSLRVRVCELADGVLLPAIADLVKRGNAALAAPADRDVRSRTYEEVIEDADRYGRVAIVQFTTPVIVEVSSGPVPFPVIPVIFERYIELWKTFSNVDIAAGVGGLKGVRMTDFRLSCVSTPYGPGAQGWVRLEMEKGRTEEEIAVFNGLVDFAFYCGTGLHTEEGLGQTRRMERAAK
jgi:hypothetical protein